MSTGDPAPEEQLGEGEGFPDEPTRMALPKWVPVAIGIVLVALAALAIYTGLHYRGNRLDRTFVETSTTERLHQDSGAPGEPEPGASRVFPGDDASNVPQPSSAAIKQGARVAIVGGKEGLSATYRASARRGLIISVQPDDAMVYVNEQAIGPAKQFATEDEMYEFPQPGNYTIRVEAPGYKDLVMYVEADPNAPAEIAKLEMKMTK